MHLDLSALWQKAQALFDGFLALLPNLLLGSLTFAAFVFAGKWVHRAGQRMAHRVRKHGNLGLILGNLFQWVFVLFGLLVSLSIVIPSFQARNLIELLGIGTVAIGFAFRDILQNFFAGILILITEPFRIGDEIVVDKFEGKVQNIETRATTIRSPDGKRVVIPNTTLFTQTVVVTTPTTKLRTTFEIKLPPDADIEASRQALCAAVRRVDGVLSDPAPDAVAVALLNGTISLLVRWWTDEAGKFSQSAVKSRVIEAIQAALARAAPDAEVTEPAKVPAS